MAAHYRDRIEEALADRDKLGEALATGVHEALKRHNQADNPVVVWRDGKMVWMKPEDIQI